MLERQNPRSLRAFPEMIRRRSGGVARNRRGGAPKGERVRHASHDARRVSHTRLTRALTGATTIQDAPFGAPPTLRFGVREGLSGKTRAQKMRRGNGKIWAV